VNRVKNIFNWNKNKIELKMNEDDLIYFEVDEGLSEGNKLVNLLIYF
jgi:hypothetical protein